MESTGSGFGLFSRCKDSLACQARDYRSALSGFSHNAKRFLLSGFLQGLGAGVLATVFGIYIKAAGLGESVVGNTEALVALAAALVCIVGTPLVSAFGYRLLMVAAIVLIVASRIGMAVFPIAGTFLALSLAVGLGDGFMRAVSSAFMSANSEKQERSHLFSIEFLTRVSAGLLGGLLGGAIPTLLQHWMPQLQAYQWTLVVGAALLGSGILPMLGLKEHAHKKVPVKSAYLDSVRGFKQWPLVGKLIAPQAFISLGGGMVIPFVPLYLQGSLHASIGQIGAILGFSSVVTAVGAFATPAIAKRLGLPTGVALMQGLSVPFLALVSVATSLPVAIGALWIRGSLMNMAGPMYNQLSMEGLTDKEKPLVAGWMFFGLNMMWLLGNVIGGRLMETSYSLPYVFAVVLYATGATLTYFFWRKRKTAEKPATVAAPAATGAAAPLPDAA